MSINDLFDSEWVLPLLLIAGFAFFIGMPILTTRKEKEVFGSDSNLYSTKAAVATIVDKRVENNYLTQSIVITHVVFELEDASRIDLAVRNASTMVIGDKGLLKYSGNQFISFQRNPITDGVNQTSAKG